MTDGPPDDLCAFLRDARAALGRSVSGDDVGRIAILYAEAERLHAASASLLDAVAELHAEAMRSHRLRT